METPKKQFGNGLLGLTNSNLESDLDTARLTVRNVWFTSYEERACFLRTEWDVTNHNVIGDLE